MLFNSSQFLFFFAVVFGVYFSLPQRYRWVLLLGASYYFYMCWKPEYVLLIIVSTLFDYYLGLQIGEAQSKRVKRQFLITSLVLNLGILFAFKYYNFFNDSFRIWLSHYNVFYSLPAFNVLLPVGISFYTFQKLSYVIDVYRGHKTPERHLGIFALYVAFFPQLVAGPIERSTRLLPQFYLNHTFQQKRVTDGLKLMAWGLFKKMVIADRIAISVNLVYNDPASYSGVALLVATYLFAFQIYCDFSGYTDIAIGASRMLGFDLMENFRRPYFSTSITDFWRRWHISLSTWFRDYLYIPLGGNRKGSVRTAANLAIVFLFCGLWHGANWTFILWGAFHGVILVVERIFRIKESAWTGGSRASADTIWKQGVKIVVTFQVICFGWIFFRANSLGDAFTVIGKIFNDLSFNNRYGVGAGLSIKECIWLLVMLLILFTVDVLQERGWRIRDLIGRLPTGVRWLVYSSGLLLILIFSVFSERAGFIYFQF